MTEYYNMNYGGKEVQVESAVRDEEGYSIKGCYAKKNEIKDGVLTINTNGGSTLGTFSANQPTNTPVTITLPNGTVQLLNQSVTFDTYTPTQAEIDAGTYAEFPYKASVTVSGISSSTYAEVTYSEEQATSLNFATFIETATDVIYLYSRTNVGTVTIPTISIGMDYSDITIDATPTSGSGNAVSSGGVYDNCLILDKSQTLSGRNVIDHLDHQEALVYMNSRLVFKNKGITGITAPVSADTSQYISFGPNESSTREMGRVGYGQNTTGDGYTFLSARRYTNDKTRTMMIVSSASGQGYVTAPYRTSDITTDDVLTAGNGVTLGTAQTITGSKTFTSSTTAPNYVMLNRSIVQNANSSAGSMTVNFMGRNSANTNDISRAYIQFYHAPGTSSATSTNLLYMRAYKDDCTNYVDLSLDATNGILGTNGKVSTSQGFYTGSYTSLVCVPSSTYNALKMGTWLEGTDTGAYLEIRANTNGTVSLILKRMNRTGNVEYNSTTIATA